MGWKEFGSVEDPERLGMIDEVLAALVMLHCWAKVLTINCMQSHAARWAVASKINNFLPGGPVG